VYVRRHCERGVKVISLLSVEIYVIFDLILNKYLAPIIKTFFSGDRRDFMELMSNSQDKSIRLCTSRQEADQMKNQISSDMQQDSSAIQETEISSKSPLPDP
jgi:hypothetical protein